MLIYSKERFEEFYNNVCGYNKPDKYPGTYPCYCFTTYVEMSGFVPAHRKMVIIDIPPNIDPDAFEQGFLAARQYHVFESGNMVDGEDVQD